MAYPIIFIDTNIWLDFYRLRGDAADRFLKHIDTQRSRIVTTFHLEMEFKKNRQSVIKEAVGGFSETPSVPVFGFLRGAKSTQIINDHVKQINQRIKKLKKRVVRALDNPSLHDPVYQIAQRVFSDKHSLCLHESHSQRDELVALAKRRFEMGYPPRKSYDTHFGDALNWEWILACARNSPGSPVIIVSRDTDYGESILDKLRLNDHLRREFHQIVGRNRKIELVSRLSDALKYFGTKPTVAEVKAEEEVISEANSKTSQIYSGQLASYWDAMQSSIQLSQPSLKYLHRIIEQLPKPSERYWSILQEISKSAENARGTMRSTILNAETPLEPPPANPQREAPNETKPTNSADESDK